MQKVPSLVEAVRHINQHYRKRGFIIQLILLDNQFEPIRGDLADMGIEINVVAQDKHVGEAERHIRTLKERCRGTHAMFPLNTSHQ